MILKNIDDDYRCSRIPSKLSVYKDHRNYHANYLKISKIANIACKNSIGKLQLHIEDCEETVTSNGLVCYDNFVGLSFEGSHVYNSSIKKYKLKFKYGKKVL